MKELHDKKFITDRDVQEGYYNRDYEDWQQEVKKEEEFRMSLPLAKQERKLAEKAASTAAKSAASKSPPKKPAPRPASKK